MNNIVSLLLTRVTIVRSLVQTKQNLRIKQVVRIVEVEPRRVLPKIIKNQLYVLIVSSQAILLEIVGNLGGGLRPLGGMEAIPTQTKS